LDLVGLPGHDPQTEAWLQALLHKLEFGQQASRVAHYRHWDGGEPDLNFEAAAVQASEDDLVIAKSMGTMVLLQAYGSGLRPAAAVLIGVPVNHYDANLRAALRDLASERTCLFIQQTGDFTGPFAQLAEVLEGTPATLVEVSGDDHVYADTSVLASIIERWADSAAGPALLR
jgi:hypothetical protein